MIHHWFIYLSIYWWSKTEEHRRNRRKHTQPSFYTDRLCKQANCWRSDPRGQHGSTSLTSIKTLLLLHLLLLRSPQVFSNSATPECQNLLYTIYSITGPTISAGWVIVVQCDGSQDQLGLHDSSHDGSTHLSNLWQSELQRCVLKMVKIQTVSRKLPESSQPCGNKSKRAAVVERRRRGSGSKIAGQRSQDSRRVGGTWGNIPGAAEGKKHKRNEAHGRSFLQLRNDKPQHTAARAAPRAVAPPLGQQRKYFPLVYLPTSKTTEEILIVRFSSE